MKNAWYLLGRAKGVTAIGCCCSLMTGHAEVQEKAMTLALGGSAERSDFLFDRLERFRSLFPRRIFLGSFDHLNNLPERLLDVLVVILQAFLEHRQRRDGSLAAAAKRGRRRTTDVLVLVGLERLDQELNSFLRVPRQFA